MCSTGCRLTTGLKTDSDGEKVALLGDRGGGDGAAGPDRRLRPRRVRVYVSGALQRARLQRRAVHRGHQSVAIRGHPAPR